MQRIKLYIANLAATIFVAVGAAGAAAFGPELLKSLISGPGQRWWFAGILAGSIGLITAGLLERRRAERLISVGILVAAIDPIGRSRGQAIFESARRYAQERFTTSVTPTAVNLPLDRAEAAAAIDGLADRVNELVGLCETLVPKATRLNLVLALRNSAAFRLGLVLGRHHRREIVVHHGDRAGYFPAVRLAVRSVSPTNGLSRQRVRIDNGDESRACLLLNLSGRGEATLGRAKVACASLNIGWIIEVRHDNGDIGRRQESYESIVSFAVAAWNDLRPNTITGNSAIIIDGVAVFALALGTQLSVSPDGPWTLYEYNDATGDYTAFAPNSHHE